MRHQSARFKNRSPQFVHNFHSLEFVDRASETQLQAGENYN